MNGDKLEIRFHAPRIGYWSETFDGTTSVQTALNVARARMGNDVSISSSRIHSAPVPPPTSIFRTDERR